MIDELTTQNVHNESFYQKKVIFCISKEINLYICSKYLKRKYVSL